MVGVTCKRCQNKLPKHKKMSIRDTIGEERAVCLPRNGEKKVTDRARAREECSE